MMGNAGFSIINRSKSVLRMLASTPGRILSGVMVVVSP